MLPGLNPFSLHFANDLFRELPDLALHASVDPHPDVVPGSLLVDLAPSPTHPKRRFWVSTDREEVTVGFAEFHAHFDWPAVVQEGNAIEFIKDLMAERILIQVTMRDGRWVGSQTLWEGEPVDLDHLEVDDVVHVRSWSGTKDREEGR